MIIQRVVEFLLCIPTIPLWMSLSAALPDDWSSLKIYFYIILILSILGWTGLARVVRSKLLALREEDFIMAASFGLDWSGPGSKIKALSAQGRGFYYGRQICRSK